MTDLIVQPTRPPETDELRRPRSFTTRRTTAAMESVADLQQVVSHDHRSVRVALGLAAVMGVIAVLLGIVSIVSVLWASNMAVTEVSEIANHALDTAEAMVETAASKDTVVNVEDDSLTVGESAFVTAFCLAGILAILKGLKVI